MRGLVCYSSVWDTISENQHHDIRTGDDIGERTKTTSAMRTSAGTVQNATGPAARTSIFECLLWIEYGIVSALDSAPESFFSIRENIQNRVTQFSRAPQSLLNFEDGVMGVSTRCLPRTKLCLAKLCGVGNYYACEITRYVRMKTGGKGTHRTPSFPCVMMSMRALVLAAVAVSSHVAAFGPKPASKGWCPQASDGHVGAQSVSRSCLSAVRVAAS